MGKLIELTNLAKHSVFVNPEQVVYIRPAGSDHPNAKTVVVLAVGEQAVLEPIDAVRERLEAGK